MKLLIGIVVSFVVGVGCRYFDIPVPSPPVIPGALLVLAMTIGYSTTNTFMKGRGKPAVNAHLCGGPSGMPVSDARVEEAALAIRLSPEPRTHNVGRAGKYDESNTL